MCIAGASTNPVKRAAVARALPGATVESVEVGSRVSEQPRGRAETHDGPQNRAERAPRSEGETGTEYDHGVGIKGRVAECSGENGLWLVMWTAATDSVRTGRGGGPSFRLPDGIAGRVHAGEELGHR